MGLPETKSGTSLPIDEKKHLVRSEVENVFNSLLSSGGVITHDGQIIHSGIENLQDVAVFTEEQRDALVRTRTLKLKAGDMRHLLPEGRTIKYISSHLILPNTNSVLGYRMGRNGGIHLFIRGINRNGDTHDYNIGADWELGHALSNHASRVLRHEKISVPSAERYSDEILKDIANKEGVGEMPITKKRYGLPEILDS